MNTHPRLIFGILQHIIVLMKNWTIALHVKLNIHTTPFVQSSELLHCGTRENSCMSHTETTTGKNNLLMYLCKNDP